MNVYEVVITVLLVACLVGFYLAYQYYKSNKVNYSNSKMSLLALGEYDRSFAVYMESKYVNMNNISDPAMIIFEGVIEFVKKMKIKVSQYLKEQVKDGFDIFERVTEFIKKIDKKITQYLKKGKVERSFDINEES